MVLIQVGTLLVSLARFLGVFLELDNLFLPAVGVYQTVRQGQGDWVRLAYLKQALHSDNGTRGEEMSIAASAITNSPYLSWRASCSGRRLPCYGRRRAPIEVRGSPQGPSCRHTSKAHKSNGEKAADRASVTC